MLELTLEVVALEGPVLAVWVFRPTLVVQVGDTSVVVRLTLRHEPLSPSVILLLGELSHGRETVRGRLGAVVPPPRLRGVGSVTV